MNSERLAWLGPKKHDHVENEYTKEEDLDD